MIVATVGRALMVEQNPAIRRAAREHIEISSISQPQKRLPRVVHGYTLSISARLLYTLAEIGYAPLDPVPKQALIPNLLRHL